MSFLRIFCGTVAVLSYMLGRFARRRGFSKSDNKKSVKLNCFPLLKVFGVTVLVEISQVHALREHYNLSFTSYLLPNFFNSKE